jgi:asparagine synthase (glutamine-hydrolysing)
VRFTQTHVFRSAYYSLYDVAQNSANNLIQDPGCILETLHALLRDSILKRMVSDVPIGAFLSGGIDSSLVVAIMQSLSSQPIRTFSIGFEDPAYNEASHAKQVAERLGAQHTEAVCTIQHVLNLIPRMSTIYDEPFADSSQIPTYLVSEIAKKEVTVSLSGDGGDELFGGYNRHVFAKTVLKNNLRIPLWGQSIVQKMIRQISPNTWNQLLQWIPGCPRLIGEKLHKFSRLLGCRSIHSVYESCLQDFTGDFYLTDLTPFSALPISVPSNLSSVERMQFLDLMIYLPSDILTKVDRASMAVSLEVREPLLDHRLIEFSFRIPECYKIHKNRGKWVLREILKQYVPESLFDRPKMGFGIPIGQFLKKELREWAEDLLNPQVLSESGFRVQAVQKTWQDHLRNRGDHQHLLWSMLMWQSWCQSIQVAK